MAKKLKPFEKLLTLMVSGDPVTRDEIETKLGSEIYTYRLSTYIWHIKTIANGVVRPIKDGRKVTAYQLVNVDEVKKYLDSIGLKNKNWVPGQTTRKPSSSKLAKELNVQQMPQIDTEAVDTVEQEDEHILSGS